MAFVTRAARPLKTQQDTGTLEPVGPGYYIRPLYQNPEHGYAPFNSTTERSSKVLATSNVYNPAPGEYEKPVRWGNHNAESSFRSRVERLKAVESTSVAPGPGAYPVDKGWIKKSSHVSPDRQERRTVLFNRQPTAPSVPARHQSYGYEETEKGQLVAQRPNHQITKDLPGPGDYNPEVPKTLKKQVDFSRVPGRHGEYFAPPTKDVPGPGTYESDVPSKGLTGSNIRKHVSAPFGSRVPLDCHKPVYEDELDAPGPGSYDVTLMKSGQRRAQPAQLGFSVGRRGTDLEAKGELPGPGAYDPYDAANAVTKRYQGLDKKAAFATTSDRFRPTEDQATAAIGPGSHEVNKGLADDIAKQRRRKGAFGSAGSRFNSSELAPRTSAVPGLGEEPNPGPGPGSYDLDPKTGATLMRLNRKETSAFASVSTRFVENPNVASEPAPGQYDVGVEWDKDKRRGYRPAKSVFVTREKRFLGTLPKHLVVGPGPGQYETEGKGPQGVSPPRGILLSTTAARFDGGPKQYVPGPGQYTLNRELVKPSFNVTLDW